MENSQLISILRTLDKRERREFRKWLASPFLNQRQDVMDLYEYVTTADHLEQDKFLEKEKIFRKIFPGESFDDARMRQVAHFLLKQLENFLAYQEINTEPRHMPLALARALRKRKLSKSFLRTLKILEEMHDAGERKDTLSLRLHYDQLNEHSTFLNEQSGRTDIKLQAAIDALDIYLLAEKLKQACYVLAHQKVYTIQYRHRFLDYVLEEIRLHPSLLEHPSIHLYYHIYQAQVLPEREGEEHFFKLRNSMATFFGYFSEAERRDIYLMTLNYCVQKMNSGNAAFVREAFELYRQGLESQVLIQNGSLSKTTFLNITAIGLRLKEYDWIASFISHYTPLLEEQHRESFSLFCQAKMFFEKQEYKKAMALLVQFDPDDILINLNAKSMLLKMFYEQGETDALESLLDSFNAYLKRKEIIGYHKQIYTQLVKYTKRLLRINPFDQQQRQKLRAEIETANPLPERGWLLEQIDKISSY